MISALYNRTTWFLIFILTLAAHAAPLEDMVRQRQFDEVLPLIEKRLVRASAQERAQLLLLRADCEVQLHRLEAAAQTLANLDPRTAPASFFRVRGQLQRAKEEDSLARKDFQEALRRPMKAGEEIRVECELAKLESKQDREKEAEAHWARALEIASTRELERWEWAALYVTRYEILLAAGRPLEALNTCRLARVHYRSLDYRRGVAWSWLGEAGLLKGMGRFEEAEAAWRQGLQAFGDDAAPALLMWGYQVLYRRDDAPALRRVLAESQKHWSSAWSDYERYHVRMLQSQIWLHGLNDPGKALEYLRLAEPLASPTPRPAGDTMQIRLAFHNFGESQSSDVEQVLWLQLSCYRLLDHAESDIQRFMEEKLSLLPENERPAWLFTLGKSYLKSNSQRAGECFSRALAVAAKSVRPRLLRAMMDAYLDAGRVLEARRAAAELRESLGTLKSSETLQLSRSMLREELTQAWVRALWTGVVGPSEASLHAAVQDELLHEPERAAELEEMAERELEQDRQADDRPALARDFLFKARRLLARDRAAEAVVACEVGRDHALRSGMSSGPYDQLMAYGLFRLGEHERALEKIRQARSEFASLARGGSADDEVECVALEVGFLLNLQLPELALERIATVLDRADAQHRPALRFARVRALSAMKRYTEALQALDRCEEEVAGSLFAMAVKMQRALVFQTLGRSEEALAQVQEGLELARELGSVRERDLVLMWYDLEPSTAPLRTTVERLEALLSTFPPGYAEKLRRQQSTQRLMALAGYNVRPEPTPSGQRLTAREFLRRANQQMSADPEFATTVPLLPTALVQKADALPKGEVLVEYYLGSRHLLILTAAREGFGLHRLEVERATLEDWAGAVRTNSQAARNLDRILLAPIEAECRGAILTMVGHGPLLSLPWDLLLSSQGKTLVERFEWKLWAGEARTRDPVVGSQILAVGGVIGANLPGSRREVEALAVDYPERVTVLTGREAGRQSLLERLPKADVVHLATHSTPSYLQLSDGRLTLSEIFNLPVKAGSLIVLSSCETADPQQQERGPVTLAAAFMAAGASQVVASLAPVTDAGAAALFEEFYKGLARGLTPSSALRQAKLARRAVDPQGDWSLFVLLGGA